MRAALFWLAAILLLGLIAPYLAPYDPSDFSFTPFESPSLKHPFGINDGGMDIFSEWLYAYRNAILFGLSVASLGVILALLVGILSALWGGWFDWLMLRVGDLLLALPNLLLLILIAAFFQPSSWLLALLLALLSFPLGARVIRAQARITRSSLHVVAASQMGGGSLYLAYRHLLPELLPLALLGALGRFKGAIIAQTTLAFLGLLSPMEKSLGMMIRQAMGFYYLEGFIYWILPPILLLWLLISAFALALFRVEERLNPRLKGAQLA